MQGIAAEPSHTFSGPDGSGLGTGAAAPGDLEVIAWLGQIALTRQLGLPAPNTPRAAALAPLLAAISGQFRDYADVVGRAREAAARNSQQLDAVVRSTGDQVSLIRATVDAATQAGEGANRIADAAAALREFATSASATAATAGDDLTQIAAALSVLGTRLCDGDAPLAEMRRAIGGVAGFLSTLARLSRHAQLLGVNASIEASHLAEAGSRFGIVAQEVRKLSSSTRDSRADVSAIVGELRASTDRVANAVRESKETTATAGGEIVGAGDALGQTAKGIDAFEQMVVSIAELAAGNRSALQAILGSVEQIAHLADGAADASHDAAKLDLQNQLREAGARVARWSLRPQTPIAVDENDAFARWVADLARGADPAASAGTTNLPAGLVRAVRELIGSIAVDERQILTAIVDIAIAVAHNSYAWRAIGTSLAGISDEIATLRRTIAESAAAARNCADLAGNMQNLVGTIRGRYEAALELLEGALARISSITMSVSAIDGFVATMDAAAERADGIMELIETISAETDLLSLNAAIEAAHAGDLGLGFSVIAEEIGALARLTNESTLSVSRLVAEITRISGELQRSVEAAAGSTDDVAVSVDGARTAIATLQAAVESATARATDVSRNAADQTDVLDGVLENVNRAGAAAEENAARTTDSGRVELAMLGSRAHSIAARRPLGTVIERVRRFTDALADELEAYLSSALRTGRLTRERLFTFTYEPVAGAQIATLGRLFDVSKVPQRGFVPVKYATPWDALIDEGMIDVLTRGYDAAVAADFGVLAMFVLDLNGFSYAYPRQHIGPWTGDAALDGARNRIKRIFEDGYALRVVRYGMGPHVATLGPRCSFDDFRAAGCTITRSAVRPWGAYVYPRDSNVVCNEVVVGIYADGQRHSCLRVCYDPNLI